LGRSFTLESGCSKPSIFGSWQQGLPNARHSFHEEERTTGGRVCSPAVINVGGAGCSNACATDPQTAPPA
jgi:hypothetical protein